MSIKYHSSALFTTDVRRLLAFYGQVLSQEVQHDFGACVILRCGLSFWQPSEDLTVAVKLGYTHHPAGNTNEHNLET